jgi:hypothetical protein
VSPSSLPFVLQAALDGAILFPKYPPKDSEGRALSPLPKKLYHIVSLLSEHPIDLWPVK